MAAASTSFASKEDAAIVPKKVPIETIECFEIVPLSSEMKSEIDFLSLGIRSFVSILFAQLLHHS